MKRFRSLFSIAAAAIALSNSASAATLIYTLAGGAATGSLGGVPFTATSFSITASGDSSTAQSGIFFGSLVSQMNVVTAPFVQINTSTGPLTATLISTKPGHLWHALSYTDGTTASVYGFNLAQTFANFLPAILFATPYYAPDISTPATYSGTLNSSAWVLPTTGGTLEWYFEALPTPASFTISAPEPATATSSLLLSLGGLSLISRRNRKA